ncbi:MAG: HAMP domain-containing histidine kinase [Streptococcaceae bacterium]|jgi:two-component system OmpR family sensor kinase|nr:HAMP domain-containing histidine kinase [Streptococcaceae bacterium]
MKILRINWRTILGLTALYVILSALVIFLLVNHTLDNDTERARARIDQVHLADSVQPRDIQILSATTSTTATKTIASGAAYAREVKGSSLVVTSAVRTNGKITAFIEVTDPRTSVAFTVSMILLFAFLLYIISIVGTIRRAVTLRAYTSQLVAKIRNIERSPLTQNYIITKNDDRITTAINHLGETIQKRLASNSETKENLYEFLEFFQFPIFVYDGKGVIHRANAAFQNEFGVQNTIDIFSPYPDFLKFLVDKMLRPDIQDKTFHFEAMNSYYAIHFNPLMQIHNRYLVALNDVSQYYQILQAHNDFIANVSHEFKTPLTSIRGFAEILGNSLELTEQNQHFAQLIESEANRLMALTNDTLSLTKQTVRLRLTETNLSALTETLLENFSPLIAQKNLTLSRHIEKIALKTEQSVVHAIYKNLIENAIYYTPAGGQISISLTAIGEQAQFSVTDTGLGLSELEKARIFERFYRTENAADSAGTGLGLAIVQKNVQDLGGHIEVRSKEGEGTSFIVTL